MVERWCLDPNSCLSSGESLLYGQTQPGNYRGRQYARRFKKGGESARYNGHNRRKGVKVHAAVSSSSFPLAMIIGSGNEHDSRRFEQVVSSVRINIGRGRPKNRPSEVLADAAYDNESIRCYLRRRGIRCSIPSNKRNQKKPQRGRPTRFDAEAYKKRGAVERFFGGSLNARVEP